MLKQGFSSFFVRAKMQKHKQCTKMHHKVAILRDGKLAHCSHVWIMYIRYYSNRKLKAQIVGSVALTVCQDSPQQTELSILHSIFRMCCGPPKTGPRTTQMGPAQGHNLDMLVMKSMRLSILNSLSMCKIMNECGIIMNS